MGRIWGPYGFLPFAIKVVSSPGMAIYLGLLIWLGFMLLGQIIRFLFRKWLSDSQNPSVNQKYS